jgi:gluconolactonase
MKPHALLAACLLSLGCVSALHAADVPPPVVSHAAPYAEFGKIVRLDPALDELLAPDARMENLAEGFTWSEGPLWLPQEQRLVFNDVPKNIAYVWEEGGKIEVFLAPSGYTDRGTQGSTEGGNGMALDAQGRVLICQHGDRCVGRLNADGRTFTVLAERFAGKRFNSPNDLCLDARGNIYFTDPPYGLKNGVRELDFHGVYRLAPDGAVTLLSKELERPNGIALTPDGRTLLVANSQDARPILMAFDLRPDGTVAPGRVFFDAKGLLAQGLRGGLDGLRIDTRGNVWTTGPGGVHILDPQGKLLGSLLTTRAANVAFGGPDGSMLYITAAGTLCRIQTKTRGQGF